MPADDAALLELADAILEGRAIEWETASTPLDDSARALFPHFRLVADIAAFARASSRFGPASSHPVSGRDLLTPQSSWGPLTIVEPIGHGSFGDVYRAIDPRLDRPVALKLLRRRDRGQAADSAVVEEARLMARVRHPNVVTVFGAERIDGRVGLWMEFIDGRSLEDDLKARGVLAPAELIGTGIELCRALGAIHRAGLLHRDLKAQNVLRDREGRVLVTDFGAGLELAELDEAAPILVGTPLYLAPEVLAGSQGSVQSDVYSLGVLIFHLATASYPVTGRTLDEVRSAHAAGRRSAVVALRPDLDPRLAHVIERALAAQPSLRYSSASEMEAALEAVVTVPRPRRVLAVGSVAVSVALLVGVLAPRLWRTPEGGTAPQLLKPGKILLPPGQIGLAALDAGAVPYIDTNGRAQLWDVSAGRPRPLTREESPGFDSDPVAAPDGRRLVFASELPDDSWEVRLLNTDGTLPRPLLARQSAFQPVPVDWSSDGQSILCLLRQKDGSTDLVIVPASGDRPRLVHTFAKAQPVSARLSPDGRFAAVTIGAPTPDVRTDLLLLDVAGGSPSVLAEGIAAWTEPAWTPDGRVFFLKESSAPGSRDAWAIPVADGRARGAAVHAGHDLGSVSFAQLTRNGLLVTPLWNSSAEVYIRSIDLTGKTPAGPPTRIATDEVGNHGAPSWSPDGQMLGYFAIKPVLAVNGAPLKALTVSDLATGARREIQTSLFFLGGYAPRWAPDGRSVIVFGSDAQPTNRYGFYRVDLATGQASAVLTGRDMAPQSELSPDGRVLYFLEDGRGVVARDLGSGRERVVIDDEHGRLGSVRVAPDGRAIAYVLQSPGSDQRSTALVLQPVGGAPRELLRVRSPEYVRVQAWTPDGHGILYTRASGDRPYRLWLMPIDGGAPVDLQATFIRSGSSEPNGLSLRPDGRRIAYPERVVQAELWLRALEGVLRPDGSTGQ